MCSLAILFSNHSFSEAVDDMVMLLLNWNSHIICHRQLIVLRTTNLLNNLYTAYYYQTKNRWYWSKVAKWLGIFYLNLFFTLEELTILHYWWKAKVTVNAWISTIIQLVLVTRMSLYPLVMNSVLYIECNLWGINHHLTEYSQTSLNARRRDRRCACIYGGRAFRECQLFCFTWPLRIIY